jgi:hypothetical protein
MCACKTNGAWDQVEAEDRERALAASRRRTREEFGVPIANDSARLNDGRGVLKADENDNRGDGCRRSRGMHGDAERAVVGILVKRMQVRDLNDGEKGQ